MLDPPRHRPLLLQQQGQLTPESRSRKPAENPLLHRLADQRCRVRLEVEAEPVLQSETAEDAGGIVLEGLVMQDPQQPLLQISRSAERIEEPEAALRIEANRQGVDREVPPRQILFHRTRRDHGQCPRLEVLLLAGGGQIDPHALAVDHCGGQELGMHLQPGLQSLGQMGRQGGRVAVHQQIQIANLSGQIEVSHGTTDQPNLQPALSRHLGCQSEALPQGRGERLAQKLGKSPLSRRMPGRSVLVVVGATPFHAGQRLEQGPMAAPESLVGLPRLLVPVVHLLMDGLVLSGHRDTAAL